MRGDPYRVFASYSRRDALLVQRLVALIRSVNVGVFVDSDSILPGTTWRTEIVSAIEQCETFLVFWCAHSATSPEVRNEVAEAFQLQKRVVPVLFDSTSMPELLGALQAVDLRPAVSQSHDLLESVLEYEDSLRKGIRPSLADDQDLLQHYEELVQIRLPEVERLFFARVTRQLRDAFQGDA